MKKIILSTISFAAISSTCFAAFAQSGDNDNGANYSQPQKQEFTAAFGSGSGDGVVVAGREVTYAELLKDPDNIELNILYARYQISKGNLTDAQSALERVLLLHPDVSVVRMLYGLVLFRLDNLVDAKAEFNKLLESDISSTDKALVQDYLGKIADKQKRTHITLTAGLGVHYDDNKNSATSDGKLTLVGVTVDSGIKEEGDIGAIVTTSGEIRYDLGFQRPMDAYGKLSLMGDQQANKKSQHMFMGRFDLGTTMQVDFGKIDISANLSKVNVNRHAYMTTTGLRARWDGNPGETYTPYVEGNYSYQFYNGLRGTTAAPQKTGARWDAKAGVQTTSIIENGISGMSASFTRKMARNKYNEFRGLGLAADHTQIFEKGRFVLGRVSYNNDSYAAPDPFINSAKKRTDNRFSVSVTGGAPVGSFFEGTNLPDEVNDIILTATLERTDAMSNISNFKYNNWRSQFMINKTIRF